MNLELSFNPEQLRALDDLVAEYNNGRANPVSRETYLSTVLINSVNDRVRLNFKRRVEQLGEAAAPLPLEVRETLSEVVETEVAKHVTP